MGFCPSGLLSYTGTFVLVGFCPTLDSGLYLEIISMHFRVFSEGQGTLYIMEDIFGVAKILNIYLGCLKFLIFFCVCV